eukprot:CAMPEP_0175462976 /NCGR_PEP_ID=MMETSP0095-20121207/68957_1 /TAXON_ID=311494 /ORGANISM="Alexandrium monilatum, Strain CCMP3105" /LENGTH=40 /DNA_ID= /DNA_START= /DNA_END= /DNA_ORIENTATION=
MTQSLVLPVQSPPGGLLARMFVPKMSSSQRGTDDDRRTDV